MFAAGVENLHHHAAGDAPWGGVGRVDFQQRLAFRGAQAGHVDEAGVEEVARRWRDHGQRIGRRRTSGLVIGDIARQAIQPLGRQPFAEELAAAGRCGEPTFGKRCRIQPQGAEALRQQLVEVHLVTVGLAAQRFVLVQEAGLVKTHTCCQCPEDTRVGPRLSHRRNGRAVQQHIGVPIGHMDVPVLQLGGGGQDVVGIVGGVGLEVFQHHGEQVFACEAGHHLA